MNPFFIILLLSIFTHQSGAGTNNQQALLSQKQPGIQCTIKIQKEFTTIDEGLNYANACRDLLNETISSGNTVEAIKLRDYLQHVFQNLIHSNLSKTEQLQLINWLNETAKPLNNRWFTLSSNQTNQNALITGQKWIDEMHTRIILNSKNDSFANVQFLYEQARIKLNQGVIDQAQALRQKANQMLTAGIDKKQSEFVSDEAIAYLRDKLIRLNDGYLVLNIEQPPRNSAQIQDKKNSITFILMALNKIFMLRGKAADANKLSTVEQINALIVEEHHLYDEAIAYLTQKNLNQAAAKELSGDRIKAQAKAMIVIFIGSPQEKQKLIQLLKDRIEWLNGRIEKISNEQPNDLNLVIGCYKEIVFSLIAIQNLKVVDR
ncbi:hypothetical protein [Legionella bononiensis]|uniref:Uncharacterized protein n=1 Tax=Legionella bononiensis TaxID=2793102 RepID=A0ABS1W8F7_9GAMM|nr:hypothetical protein [Legionella bononiensis]MBL7479833.1 hypothetical protein [Legionella bononiensis]MBL7525652.1 hypothetical protein [Legionella bononiensis]MBL7561835.1 hypothetical protein [Legionella bononiensis]